MVLDEKAVQRITLQCGEGLLTLRHYQLDQFRKGTLLAGTELVGKRVSVQIDGGRSRIRGNLNDRPETSEILDELGLPTRDKAGRSRVVGKRTFEAPWREPKLVTIFMHDEQGRMVKTSRATIEGTFAGPDALAEMIVDLGSHRDDQTLGEAGRRADLRNLGLLPCDASHLGSTEGTGARRCRTTAVVPRTPDAPEKRTMAARGSGTYSCDHNW